MIMRVGKTAKLSSTKAPENICTVCRSTDISVFFELDQVPVHCNLLWPERDKAINAPRGDIRLGFCRACGHIFNLAFDPDCMRYNQEYENSLHFSALFQQYARSLAARLINRHHLYDKVIIEIGCGKGDFLTLLCKLGGNRGVGFDPGCMHESTVGKAAEQITFIKDFYSERYAGYKADFICCRHVLEHIQSPLDFLINLRQAIGNQHGTVVFFEVPNVMFTLKDIGIWDLIYEHCSYFNISSLAHVFTSCGFEICNISEAFEKQFLCIESLPVESAVNSVRDYLDHLEIITHDMAVFADRYQHKVETWLHHLERIKQANKKVVLWGGGSKGVSFLNTMKASQIKYVIDINPYKQGMYVPGTGQKIVPPEFLRNYQPHVIIVMNPVYYNEILQIVKSLNLSTKLLLA